MCMVWVSPGVDVTDHSSYINQMCVLRETKKCVLRETNTVCYGLTEQTEQPQVSHD
jgi:hypothetical protein